MAHLLLQKEDKPLFKRPLDQTRLTIGRDPSCDIQLLDIAISRQHCAIERQNRVYVLKDSSRNGTFVNAKKIQEIKLHEGDRIQIGPWRLVFSANGNETAGETFVERRQDGEPAILNRMLGNSRPLKKVLDHIRRAADSAVPVCLIGASGSGKDLAARLIHDLSRRSEKPFVAVNCGAIPANLIE
ncbi:MAG: FHA domain-containing protein, partial [Deltaproteobacteria bacterium]|nr:FHA domain-containing protein [Deltaproteobacteria bacterium]